MANIPCRVLESHVLISVLSSAQRDGDELRSHFIIHIQEIDHILSPNFVVLINKPISSRYRITESTFLCTFSSFGYAVSDRMKIDQ